MAHIEADCALIKKDGEVIGVSLIAQPQTEAEIFCSSMPKYLNQGQAQIMITYGKIKFVHPQEGEVSFTIEKGDAVIAENFFNNESYSLVICNDKDAIMRPGFKIVREGMEEEGEKTELTRL